MKSSPWPADDELDRLVALGITRQQVEAGDDCLDRLDPEVLAGYADGGLSAEERAAGEAHLARCRDCRQALALQVESDPLLALPVGPSSTTPDRVPGSGSHEPSGRPRIVKFASTWLPLAAALVVAAGLWGAFKLSRQEAPQLASAPAQLSARNEPPAASPAEVQPEPARPSTPNAPSPTASSDDRAVSAQAPPPARARGAYREEVAAAARPNAGAEADRRVEPAAAPALAPPPPPQPSAPAALADAAPAQAPAVNAANQNAQQQVTLQQQNAINQQTGPMANLNVAPPPAKADERRQAEASQRAANDAKRETASEKNAGGASSAKSVDGFAKAAEEPKSLARAKAAPESPAAAAPVDAASTKSASAASGRKTEAESAASGAAAPRPATEAEGRNTAFRTGIAGASGGAGAAADTAAEARTDDKDAGVIKEAITVVTSTAPAPASAPGPVLQSADGARWWRIRAPSTIESSADRGASWTVEYSDPSARLVRGAAAAKGGCWMIGANGLVLRTRPDGGWERVTQPTTRNLVTLTATDHRIATVTDDQGRAWRTTDGGATWR